MKSNPEKKRIRKLFARFNGAYGQSWSNRFTSQAMLLAAVDEWHKALFDYSNAQLDRAYSICINRHQLAPTLPQLKQICQSTVNHDGFTGDDSHLPECNEPDCNKPATTLHEGEKKHYCAKHWYDRGGFNAQFAKCDQV